MPGRPPKEPKRPHVKKPLNAFMLYMKEQRPKIAAEFTLKESAAINQILGKRVGLFYIFFIFLNWMIYCRDFGNNCVKAFSFKNVILFIL